VNDAVALAVVAPGLDPAATRLLGAGLWGRVLDLGDGTVVKLIAQSAAGVGDALDLWANEVAALQAVARADLPFAVPRLVDAAPLDEAATGYRAYVRLTRLIGHALDDDSLEALAHQPGGRFARQLGEALAALHGAGLGFDDPRADEDRNQLAAIAPVVADVADARVIAAIARSLAAIEQPGATVANHGDINSTNVMVDGEGQLVGLIDWAEARADWREAEFCHLMQRPALGPLVRDAYEVAAGLRLDDRRLQLVGLHNALLGLAICRRLGEPEEAAWNLGHVRRLMAALGPEALRG